jgi:hypothetical protein
MWSCNDRPATRPEFIGSPAAPVLSPGEEFDQSATTVTPLPSSQALARAQTSSLLAVGSRKPGISGDHAAVRDDHDIDVRRHREHALDG